MTMNERKREHERLEALIGRWKTTGRTLPSAGGGEIDATDAYEWLPGEFGLLHTVDARVGDQTVEGAEVIGYDPDRGTYVTLYVGTDGPTSYEARLTDEDGGLVWRMQSERTRFTGSFDDDRTTITGHWELLSDRGTWHPWMDITLTKS
jgi:hypothetical protein